MNNEAIITSKMQELLEAKRFSIAALKTYEYEGQSFIKIKDIGDFSLTNTQTVNRHIQGVEERLKRKVLLKVSGLNGNCILVSDYEEVTRDLDYSVENLLKAAKESQDKLSNEILSASQMIISKNDLADLKANLKSYQSKDGKTVQQIEELNNQILQANQRIQRMFSNADLEKKVNDAVMDAVRAAKKTADSRVLETQRRFEELQKDLFTSTQVQLKINEAVAAAVNKKSGSLSGQMKNLKESYEKMIDEMFTSAQLEKKISQALEDVKINSSQQQQQQNIKWQKEKTSLEKELTDNFHVQFNNSVSEFEAKISKIEKAHSIETAELLEELKNATKANSTSTEEIETMRGELLDYQLQNGSQGKSPLVRVFTDIVFQTIYLVIVMVGTACIAYFELSSSFNQGSTGHWTGDFAMVLVAISLALAIAWSSFNTNHWFWTNLAVLIFALCEWSSFAEYNNLDEILMNVNGEYSTFKQIGSVAFSLLLPSLTVLLAKYQTKSKSSVKLSQAIKVLGLTLQTVDKQKQSNLEILNFYKKEFVRIADENSKSIISKFLKDLFLNIKEKFKKS